MNVRRRGCRVEVPLTAREDEGDAPDPAPWTACSDAAAFVAGVRAMVEDADKQCSMNRVATVQSLKCVCLVLQTCGGERKAARSEVKC